MYVTNILSAYSVNEPESTTHCNKYTGKSDILYETLFITLFQSCFLFFPLSIEKKKTLLSGSALLVGRVLLSLIYQ